MLSINNICVSYKGKGEEVKVLKDFSLDVSKGEILAVLGPSGCGKSTLIQVLSGMIKNDSGTIKMESGQLSASLDSKVHNIAVIPQNCGLLPWKTVRKNCLLPLKLHKVPIDIKKKSKLEEICKALKIEELLERYPNQLSGGQVQRVALARAFLQEPDLLLMDEPFSALDAISKQKAWELFLEIFSKHNPTTILVTHSMEEALYLGKEILILDEKEGKQLERVSNPYFGNLETQDGDYLKLKKKLHTLLKITDKEGIS